MSDILCNLLEIDHNELEDYISDPLVICQSKFLPKVTGAYFEEPAQNEDKIEIKNNADEEWYPLCNSYYNHSEQVDPFARVNHLLDMRSHFFYKNLSTNDKKDYRRRFRYSTREAQIDYLRSKPLSFLILGKPSIGEEELGKLLSEYWQCVYIEPETLVREEIQSGTRAGQCLEFNLRSGRAIGIDVLLRLVKKKVRTESAKHRGFVLCGLPLIPNDLYEEDPITTESTLFTVQEILEEVIENAFFKIASPPVTKRRETGKAEHTKSKNAQGNRKPPPPLPDYVVPPDLGDAEETVCEPPQIGTNYKKQLEEIMSLYDGSFMIIYMVCADDDVVEKRKNYKYDIYSQTVIDLLQEKTERNLLSRKDKLGLRDLKPIEEILEESQYFPEDSSDLIHPVKLPRDFPSNVQTQMQSFHDVIVELFESLILDHEPELFLKVDGRTTVTRMFNSVKWKLRTLNVQKVLLPEILVPPESMEVEGEGFGVSRNFKFDSVEKCFQDFSRRKVVNPMFKWEYSDWGPRCPVAMAEGNFMKGDPAYAVQFMNYIFFLSDQKAFLKFHRNPRPYLLPPNPRSHGKLYVVGPSYSGKTAVSTALAYLIDSTVLCSTQLYKDFVNQKHENLVEKMKQAMIADKLARINSELMEQHNSEKKLHEEKVDNWLEKFQEYLDKEVLKRNRSELQLQLSSFPVLMGSKHNTQGLKQMFEGIFLNETTANYLLENPNKMRFYLPDELKKEVSEYVPVRELDEQTLQSINDYIKNADLDEIVLGEEDLLDMYSSAIRQVETKYMEVAHCDGGWIIDGMSSDFDLFKRIYDECPPDHVIILEDSSESKFLVDRFKTRSSNVFTEYRKFFESIGMPIIAEKISDEDHQFTKEKVIEDILGDILTSRQFLIRSDDPEDISEKELLERRESQIAYRNELNQYKTSKVLILDFLKSKKKDLILVDVSDKSLSDIMEEAIFAFANRYRAGGEIMTDHDRLQEAIDFGIHAEAEGFGEDVDMKDLEDFETNRRYGDTIKFCPVTFHDKGVLWEGKKDHVAKFQGRLYFCSSKEDLEAFIKKPWKYLPIHKPFAYLPPPRICVIGNSKSGKTSVSKIISKNFGCCYISFMDFLRSKGAEEGNSENFQNIQEYLHTDTPLKEELLKEFLYRLWFEDPYRTMGFIIDDFPKRPSDVTVMVNHKTIPDAILTLKIQKKDLSDRVIEKGVDEWQFQMQEVRSKRYEEYLEELKKWEQVKKERFELLLEEKRERRYAEKRKQGPDGEKPYLELTDEEQSYTSKSQITFDSVADQEDINQVNKQLEIELPEPVFDSQVGGMTEVLERLKSEFEDKYPMEIKFLRNIEELAKAAQIPLQEVKSEKHVEATQYSALFAVDRYEFKTRSFFERTYEVSLDVAEKLLGCGFYFLSIFGRTCPIQYHRNDLKIQLFIPKEQQIDVFPVIHRQYIYFLVGKESKELFRGDPLKYADIAKFEFPLLPVRIAVIGPPKCGKTALAERFRNEFGFKVSSKGQAARYVMNYLPFSSLGVSMENRLRAGLVLKEKMVLGCVEATSYDPRAVTQGFVMDGYPNSAKEVKYLASMGLMPHLVIDLYTDNAEIYHYVSQEATKMFVPPYSKHFMEHRYELWQKDQARFRTWLDREYQNMVRVKIDTSMWDIWEKAYEFVKAAVYEIRHYFIHCKDDWPLRLANMLVSPLEFMERESCYKTYCPCCLYHSQRLTTGGFPPDRTGLIHFRKHFYYLCPDHVEEFLDNPCAFLPPYNPNKLPQDLPKKIFIREIPKDVFLGGNCVVCFKKKKLGIMGSLDFAVKFAGRVYIFDSPECEKKFFESPLSYCNVHVKFNSNPKYPSLSYKDLPTLGALEQYVAKDVIEAIKDTAAVRPVLPGLSVKESALLSVGLHLKARNSKLQDRGMYEAALDLMHKRRKGLLGYLDLFKKYRNPFIYYEEPVPALKITDWIRERFDKSVSAWSYTDMQPDEVFKKEQQRKDVLE